MMHSANCHRQLPSEFDGTSSTRASQQGLTVIQIKSGRQIQSC